MDQTSNRRRFLKMSGGLLAGLCAMDLSSCADGGVSAAGGKKQLQLVYWGSAVRAKKTKKTVELYLQHHKDVSMSSQFTDFGSYWPKMATQISGGSAPDLIQMDMAYIAQYIKKGLLLDLSRFVPQTIHLDDFNKVMLKSGESGSALYGIPFGGNFLSIYYNQDLLKRADVEMPDHLKDWTWDGFAEYCRSIAKASGPGVYGINNAGGDLGTFEAFVRQRQKELYTSDGKRGFNRQDVSDWFSYWIDMSKAGGCVSIEEQLAYGGTTPQESTLITGRAAMNFVTSNQIEAYQKTTPHKLSMFFCPTTAGSSDPGYYIKASMLISASATTKYPEQVADFINFIFNDKSAINALGIERGIPGSAKAIALLKPTFNAAQKKQLALVQHITATARPKVVLDPPAASTVSKLFGIMFQNIAFGRMTIAEATDAFVSQADKALNRIG